MNTKDLIVNLDSLVRNNHPHNLSSDENWIVDDIKETCSLTFKDEITRGGVSTGTELDNLINGCELDSFIVLGGISLYGYESHDQHLLSFGSGECGIFVINTVNQGIYLVDHESGSILFECSQNAEGFIGALYWLMEYYFFRLISSIDHKSLQERANYASKAAMAAGGERYFDCFEHIINTVA
jgi:hypothetical protein